MIGSGQCHVCSRDAKTTSGLYESGVASDS